LKYLNNSQKYNNLLEKIYFEIKGIFLFGSEKESNKFDRYFNNYQELLFHRKN